MEYTNFVVSKITGSVYMLENKWDEDNNFTRVKSRANYSDIIPTNELIRVPTKFTAYIKNDTTFHGKKGWTIELTFNEELFFDKKMSDSACLWFYCEEFFNIPNKDIDFTSIKTISVPSIEDPIPSLPTLDELQNCIINFDGRKTIVTYYDSFIGESKCHPDDKFFITTGIAYAFDRAKKAKEIYDEEQKEKNKIKVGDVVNIIDEDEFYPWCDEKVTEICNEIHNTRICARYAYGRHKSMSTKDYYIVHYIDDDYAYLESIKDRLCYLVTADNVAKTTILPAFKKGEETEIIGFWVYGDDSYEYH